MRHSGDKSYRIRAGVVVVAETEQKVLLMFRRRKGHEFYVIPAGGVEEGEEIEAGALRELKEESNIDAQIAKKFMEVKYPNCAEHYFLSTSFTGEAKLGGEELERSSENNFYEIRWVPFSELSQVTIYPISLLPFLKREFPHLFS